MSISIVCSNQESIAALYSARRSRATIQQKRPDGKPPDLGYLEDRERLDQIAQLVRGALHFQEDQTKLRAAKRQSGEHGFLTNRHENDIANLAADEYLIELPAFEFIRDSVAQREHCCAHCRYAILFYISLLVFAGLTTDKQSLGGD